MDDDAALDAPPTDQGAGIAASELLVARQALQIDLLKGAARSGPARKSAPASMTVGPPGSPSSGGELMDVARASVSVRPGGKVDDAGIVAEIRAIADALEGDGSRRVGAELRHRWVIVNAKTVRRPKKAQELSPRRRRRGVRMTESDHDGPIFPVVAKGFERHGRARLRGEPSRRHAVETCQRLRHRSARPMPTAKDLTDITIGCGAARAALDRWPRTSRHQGLAPRRLVPPRGGIRNRPQHRRAPRGERAASGGRAAQAAARMCVPSGSGSQNASQDAPRPSRRARRLRFDGPARQSR